MHGNAREWCASPYAKRYDGSEEKGSEVEANRRTIRGGSYYLEPWRCRSAFRGYVDWTAGYAYDGLRVIVSAKVQD
jgi:formylglycine-generating enzyme required for sulfatase activity